VAIVPVADEDFLAGALGAGNVETTRCPNYRVWIAQYIFVPRVRRQLNLSVRE